MKADNETMKETEQVGPSLKGFKSGPAMDVFLERWSSQMKYVENLLKNDVAGTLRLSASAFETREHAEADRHRKGGKGSGVDVAASTTGGAIVFRLTGSHEPQIGSVRLPNSVGFAGIFAGRSASTTGGAISSGTSGD